MEKGFYIAANKDIAYGFSLAIVYIPQHRDFQISIMFGNQMVAIGYKF